MIKRISGSWYFCEVYSDDWVGVVKRVLLWHNGQWNITKGNYYAAEWKVRPVYEMVKGDMVDE